MLDAYDAPLERTARTLTAVPGQDVELPSWPPEVVARLMQNSYALVTLYDTNGAQQGWGGTAVEVRLLGLDNIPKTDEYAYFLTAAHCVRRDNQDPVGLSLYDPKADRRVQIPLKDIRRIMASEQADNHIPDFALLAIRRADLEGIQLAGGLELAPAAALRRGDRVWVAGFPASSADGQLSELAGTPLDITGRSAEGDMAISGGPLKPGMSGGAVVDRQGRAIAILSRDYINDPSDGFAVPLTSSYVLPMLNSLRDELQQLTPSAS